MVPSLCCVVETCDDLPSVRRHLATCLRANGASDETVESAQLLASELVSNVLAHTDSAAEVTATTEDHVLRVAVADESDEAPTIRPVDPTRVGGNGLRIVEAFAATWGTRRRPHHGKVVWFTLALP
ncbi:MAG TPA: ATP-binding protein [Aquihabitans sp.]|nr:ATP-binding protein [Aquihabitans sp.]